MASTKGAGEPFFLEPQNLVAGTNVLAIEVHQASKSSSDISIDARLTGHEHTILWRGPYLQVGTDHSVTLRWRTSPATDSQVWYGPSPGALGQSVFDPAVTTEHEVEVTGLPPSTTTFYGVGTSTRMLAGDDLDHAFRTGPPPGTPQATRIWVLGDSGAASPEAAAVRDAYLAYSQGDWTDLVLLLGDNAYRQGTDVEYQHGLFELFADPMRRATFWSVRGNHEYHQQVYEDIFTLPTAGEAGGLPSGVEAYYSFDRANIHFVCLDSQGSDHSVGGPMWTWLQADLQATDQDWIVAAWHHPPYSKGSHDSDTESRLIEMRENFVPLLEGLGVDLVLAGHSHAYERSFLIDGHYGDSSTFGAAHQKDAGTGRVTETGAYLKPRGGNAGAVYVVAGSSSKSGSGTFDHPAMVSSTPQFGSVVIDVEGGRMQVKFLQLDGQIGDHFTLLNEAYEGAYCAPSANSDGCAGRLEMIGTPSMTDPSPFLLCAADVTPGQGGLFFYGLAPLNKPLLQGRLCVAPPHVRTPVQNTGGAGPCSGSLSLDFNAWIQAGGDPNLVTGTSVYCQAYYRDPAGPVSALFTDALTFWIRP